MRKESRLLNKSLAAAHPALNSPAAVAPVTAAAAGSIRQLRRCCALGQPPSWIDFQPAGVRRYAPASDCSNTSSTGPFTRILDRRTAEWPPQPSHWPEAQAREI